MQCKNCGQVNPPVAQFCAACGAPLAPVAEAPTTFPDSAPPSRTISAGSAYAGFWVRFLAAFIDSLVVYAVYGTFSALAFLAPKNMIVVNALLLPLPWLYWWLLTGIRGQTLGKMVVRIKVVDDRGSPPGLGRAFLREFIGKFLSALVIYLGFFSIAWDMDKQGWHDKIAHTHVVRKNQL